MDALTDFILDIAILSKYPENRSNYLKCRKYRIVNHQRLGIGKLEIRTEIKLIKLNRDEYLDYVDPNQFLPELMGYLTKRIYTFDGEYYKYLRLSGPIIGKNRISFSIFFDQILYNNCLSKIPLELIAIIGSYLTPSTLRLFVETKSSTLRLLSSGNNDIYYSILLNKYPEMGGLYTLVSDVVYGWSYILEQLDQIDYLKLIRQLHDKVFVTIELYIDTFDFTSLLFQYFTKINFPEVYSGLSLEFKLIKNWKSLYQSLCSDLIQLLNRSNISMNELDIWKYYDSYLIYKYRNKIQFESNNDVLLFLFNIPSYYKNCKELIMSLKGQPSLISTNQTQREWDMIREIRRIINNN